MIRRRISGAVPFPGRLVAGGPVNQWNPVVAPPPTSGAFVAFEDDSSIRLQYFDGSGIAQGPARASSCRSGRRRLRGRVRGGLVDPQPSLALPALLSRPAPPDAQFMRELAYSTVTGQTLAVWDDRRKGTWDDTDVYGSLVGPVVVPSIAVSLVAPNPYSYRSASMGFMEAAWRAG
jgi:hypothetical protein